MRDPWALKPPLYHEAPVYEHTNGHEVAAICEQIGFAPDPEQQLALNDLFAVVEDPDNAEWMKSAAFAVAVIATRQNLKTGLMKMASIGWLFVTQEEVVTWSAHQFDTAKQAFTDMESIIKDSPLLRKRMPPGPHYGVFSGKGEERIQTRDGRLIKFKARTNTGGRGLTGDKIILDEAFALTPAILGTLIPTLTAVPDPQILYGSSAGLSGSERLREIRDRGRVGSPGLAYLEWAAPFRSCASEACLHRKPSDPLYEPGCAADDEELWALANPLLGRSRPNGTGLTLAKLRNFREEEPPEEFLRERLGWWDEPGASDLFGPGKWESCAALHPPESMRMAAMAVAVSEDLKWSSIVAAGVAGDRIVIQPLQHGPGRDWVVNRVRDLQREHRVKVIIDDHGPGADLVKPLQTAGVDLHATPSSEALDAFAAFHQLVADESLLHGTFPEMERAINGATTKYVGDRMAWARRKSTADITPLEGATLAAWWASRPQGNSLPPPTPAMTDDTTHVPEDELATMGF